tara:strand:- start:1370 stop:1573 length:204 start_codon:yes stop_codon:yes gene_type:complete
MDKKLLEGVYLFDGLYPDPDGIIKNFKEATAEEKEKFYPQLLMSGLLKNPMIHNMIMDYEYERALSS